jgi:hypothetical protein
LLVWLSWRWSQWLLQKIIPSKADAPKAINLPEPRTDGGISVEKVLKERRYIRSFGKNDLTLNEVSQILWAAQGVTDDKGHRTAPSAMGGYPLQVYLLADNVTGLPSGVYHYSSQGHNLTVMAQGKIDEYYNATAGFEAWIKTAPAIFVITGDFSNMNQMPRQDLSRLVYIEAERQPKTYFSRSCLWTWPLLIQQGLMRIKQKNSSDYLRERCPLGFCLWEGKLEASAHFFK